MRTNIRLFKTCYFLAIILFSLIQIIISKTADDYIILGIVISLNLLILFYCIDEDKFNRFPISLSVIFFSVFFNSSSSLFFKTIELDTVSSNLLSGMGTYLFFLYANITILITHFFYVKNQKTVNDSYFFNLNHKMGLFHIDTNFLFLLGLFAISSKLLIEPFLVGTWDVVAQEGLPLALDFLKGFNIFYLFPFALIMSNKLFDKEYKVNKLIIFILFIAVVITSIGSNRRDVLFFGLLSLFLILIIIFLLGLIKLERKNFVYLLLFIVITYFAYPKIVSFNKIYTYERGRAMDASRIENIKSFYNSFHEVFTGKLDIELIQNNQMLKRDPGTQISEYYESIIFERINLIQYADNIINYHNVSSQIDLSIIRNHTLNRLISIAPQFIINIFTNNFQKTNYIYLTSSSLMNRNNNRNYFSINDVGSSLAEMKIIFGIFFFIPLIIISYFAFTIFDSFYDKKKKIFSPVIVVLFYFSGAGVLNFYSSASFDLMLTTFFREIPQAIILYLIAYFLYNQLLKKNNKA